MISEVLTRFRSRKILMTLAEEIREVIEVFRKPKRFAKGGGFKRNLLRSEIRYLRRYFREVNLVSLR